MEDIEFKVGRFSFSFSLKYFTPYFSDLHDFWLENHCNSCSLFLHKKWESIYPLYLFFHDFLSLVYYSLNKICLDMCVFGICSQIPESIVYHNFWKMHSHYNFKFFFWTFPSPLALWLWVSCTLWEGLTVLGLFCSLFVWFGLLLLFFLIHFFLVLCISDWEGFIDISSNLLIPQLFQV